MASMGPARAAGQTRASALSLDAPEGCPDEAALEGEVASLVGHAIEEIVLPAGLDTHVTITREGARFVLSIADEDGARTLRDGSCAALVRAAGLIIALRIDADAATLAAASASEPPTPPAAEASPPTEASVPGRDGHDYDAFEWSHRLPSPYGPRTLPPIAIGAGVLVEAGVVPVISASLAADLVVRVEHFETRARVAYVLEQGQARHYGVSAAALLATVLACGRPYDAEFALAFCGGIEAGPLLARSFGVVTSGESLSWTVAGVVGLWLPLIPWPGIDISLGAELWVRIYRPEFEIQGIGPVWDSDPIGGRFGLLFHFSP
jgi:hypothetical protein